MKIVVVIPTYNEAENIGRMLDTLLEVFKLLPEHTMAALVVDSNSPDGTAGIVKGKLSGYSWAHLLEEKEKKGLGASYFNGFRYAMNTLGADAVIEMDADFQHDPWDLPRLIAKFDVGYDYVIGSRFVKGGSIPKEWALYRKILSVGGNLFTKLILGIYSVDDFTSGFRLTRVKGFLDQIDFDSIRTKGFAYKMEMLLRLHRMGASIAQVPIKFGLRDRGNSKMENNNFVDSLTLVLKLRLEESKEFVKFCVVGGMGFIVDFGTFNILGSYIPSLVKSGDAAKISGLIAMLVTYLLNNYWSFHERKITKLSQQAITFVVYALSSAIPIYARGILVKYSVSTYGFNFWIYNTAFMIGIVLGLIWNYSVYSRIIWRRR